MFSFNSAVVMAALTLTPAASASKGNGGLIAVVSILALVAIAYFCLKEKNPIEKIKGIIAAKKKTIVKPVGVQTKTETSDVTYDIPAFIISQIDNNNHVAFEFPVYDKQIRESVALSRPGSEVPGIHLKKNAEDPKRSLSVGSAALTFFFDEDGNIVARNTRNDSHVQIRYSGKELIKVPYDSDFDIENNMFIVCGIQVLYISFPDLVNFNLVGTIGADDNANNIGGETTRVVTKPRQRFSSKN